MPKREVVLVTSPRESGMSGLELDGARIDVADENDPFIFHAEQTIAAFNTAARPGRYLVDLIPIRRYFLLR